MKEDIMKNNSIQLERIGNSIVDELGRVAESAAQMNHEIGNYTDIQLAEASAIAVKVLSQTLKPDSTDEEVRGFVRSAVFQAGKATGVPFGLVGRIVSYIPFVSDYAAGFRGGYQVGEQWADISILKLKQATAKARNLIVDRIKVEVRPVELQVVA